MRNTFKLIIRSLVRKPMTTTINLLGLSVSLALVLILSAYSFSEFSTDKFHQNHENIFIIQPGKGWLYTPAILKPVIDNSLEGVEKLIRVRDKWKAPVYQFGQNNPLESDLIFADSDFFEVFDYKALEGDLKTALSEPMSLVISEKLARRLFGEKPALGKTVKLDDKHLLTVSAVFKDQALNSIFSFNSITNIETVKKVQPNPSDFTHWNYNNYQTFLQLNNHVNKTEIAKNIVKLFPESNRERLSQLKLVELSKIYFANRDQHISYLKFGNKQNVIYLALVAMLVLIVALVNFINITASHWHDKIKQTGVMKVIGAWRPTIIVQMLLETFLLFTFALFLGYCFVFLSSTYLARKTEIVFSPELFMSPGFLLISISLVTLLSILCGIVPALRIAYSATLINLKKKVTLKTQKSFGKGIMVSLQFVVTIVLILFTILVQKQVDYGNNNIGINQESIIGVPLTKQMVGKKDVLKESLLAKANVEEVVFTQYYPGKMNSGWSSTFQINGEEIRAVFRTFSADAGFFDIMGLELTEGRFYHDHLETDKYKVVVNHQFLKEFGITEPIGFVLPQYRRPDYEIVGVVKDFHFKSVNEPIAPLVIRNDDIQSSVALVRLKTENFKALKITYENIRGLTAELSPSFPVNVTFFDQAVEAMYQSEIKFRRAFTMFSICAIVISCMGILAMSLFATRQRIKEIGIRKVNGAKVYEILAMLNKDFIKWVVIAFVIACPIAYYAMNKWLENFAYKTTLSWWIFALAGVLALGIALLTVSFQSYKAAIRNPVEALRYE